MIALDMPTSTCRASPEVVSTLLGRPAAFAGRHVVSRGLSVLTSSVSNDLEKGLDCTVQSLSVSQFEGTSQI